MLVLGVVCVFSSERKSREGGRVNQVVMGPAVEEDAPRAGGADTSLPGREALQTPFQEGTAVRRPGLCPGAWVPGPRSSRTHSCGWCVARMQVPI